MSLEPARVLVLGVKVPFTRGGAEVLVDSLVNEIRKKKCIVDLVELPFNAQTKDDVLRSIAQWKMLRLDTFNGHRVDAVIATKFPSYLARHRNKVVWLVHQHRQLYDLYGTRFGDSQETIDDEAFRQIVYQADRTALSEASKVFAISGNVSMRLKSYLGVGSKVLLPPLPLSGQYVSDESSPYLLSVGRVCSIKRIDLLIKSLPQINDQLKLKIVGLPDEPGIVSYLESEIEKHHLWHRVEFLGRVSTAELLSLYARAFAVYYAPFDEDYGYVTLEAFASGKPVITAWDSGGVLEFVQNGVNGIVTHPVESLVAQGVNSLFNDREFYQRLCQGAKKVALPQCWDTVIENLLGVDISSIK